MASMINTILEHLLALIGSPTGVAFCILIFIISLMIIKRMSFAESWLIILPLIGSLSTEIGGNYLPDWFMVVVIIPFGWIVVNILIKFWQAESF